MPLSMSLIRGFFLTSGFVLNVCSAHRRAFLTHFHRLSHADFSLFSALCFPVAFWAGLWWTSWFKRQKDSFKTLERASFLGLVFFLASGIPVISQTRTYLFGCMFGYVACMSGLIPIICIECFAALKDRTFFGQNLMLAYVGNLILGPVIRTVCSSESWGRLYAIAIVIHLGYLLALRLLKRHFFPGQTYRLTLMEQVALENEKEADPLPIYFQNTPWESDMSGSAFSTSTTSKFGISAFTKRQTSLEEEASIIASSPKTSKPKKENLLHNPRFICILACGFFVALSTNLMKIAMPTYLEEHLKMRPWMDSVVFTLGTLSEFAILMAFPRISHLLSYQALFLLAVSLYFLYISMFCTVGKLSAIGLNVQLLLFAGNTPLKGISLGLMQCVAPLCIAQECGKQSNGQKVYSAVVSMAAGFIAGLFGYWIALENSNFDLESSAVFRHCILWCFVALAAAVWMFVFRKQASRGMGTNFLYEALLIDNLYSE